MQRVIVIADYDNEIEIACAKNVGRIADYSFKGVREKVKVNAGKKARSGAETRVVKLEGAVNVSGATPVSPALRTLAKLPEGTKLHKAQVANAPASSVVFMWVPELITAPQPASADHLFPARSRFFP